MIGEIYTWSLLGYGFVLANKKDLYFLHHPAIKEGMHLVAIKQPVVFDIAPALTGKKHPRAINAVVGGAQ